MIKAIKRLKEHVSGKKGVDKISVTIDANIDPLMAKLKEIREDVSGKIESITLSDNPKFSESFIAELDKALNDYHQKQFKKNDREKLIQCGRCGDM
nr:MAG: hypothetical protein [Bacteriophage sp.]